MLENIHVKDLALIQESEISFGPSFNIITGETGAGKSVIIGSVGLALGDRASETMIRSGAEYALIELLFRVGEKEKDQIAAMDFPAGDEDTVLIQRRIYPGRTVCKVNGETVTARQLKQLSGILIDIYGQREHQSLLEEGSQQKVLDSYAGEKLSAVTEQIRVVYSEYSRMIKQLAEENTDAVMRRKQAELARFEVREIEEAQLREGEDEKLEADYRRMSNSQRISEALNRAYECCNTDDSGAGAGAEVSEAIRELKSVSSLDSGAADLEKQLADIDSLLSDFCRQISSQIEDMTYEPEEFADTEERLNLINHLKDKYGSTIPEINSYMQKQSEAIEKYENYDAYCSKMKAEKERLQKELMELCGRASEIRRAAAKELSGKMEAAMADLNFLSASFEIRVTPETEKAGPDGYDEIEYFISTNPGEGLRPLNETASGGELSRIMLALKTVIAERDDIGTLIFDEIDAGISGKTAWMAACKMTGLAKDHQIICITHLPQIAAMEDTHFLIEKSVKDGRTVTEIRKLAEKESTAELARMLGGDKITGSALQNARDMQSEAEKVKKGR
jgi:DNA repair protein RecN (Recombination protein N)